MIPRKNFVRIMNKKAAPLIESCKATSKTKAQDSQELAYLTLGIRQLCGSKLPYNLDCPTTIMHHRDFINIIAELEDGFHVVERNNPFYKSSILSSIQLCPDDLVKRLKDPTLMPKALEDWKLADEFLLALSVSSQCCFPDRTHSEKHPNTGIIFCPPQIVKQIDDAVKEFNVR